MYKFDKLRGRMSERHVTQADIAKLLGIKECTVSQKLNNHRKIKLNEAKKIAEYLDIPDSEFVSFFYY
jgi:transcriptional regulator with XRE-family HTH domain